jgi:hypothetical protein
LLLQLQILITDDSCAKLLALYAYEGSRPRGSLEVIYHSNVLELLPEDDRCFRFEFSQVLLWSGPLCVAEPLTLAFCRARCRRVAN